MKNQLRMRKIIIVKKMELKRIKVPVSQNQNAFQNQNVKMSSDHNAAKDTNNDTLLNKSKDSKE